MILENYSHFSNSLAVVTPVKHASSPAHVHCEMPTFQERLTEGASDRRRRGQGRLEHRTARTVISEFFFPASGRNVCFELNVFLSSLGHGYDYAHFMMTWITLQSHTTTSNNDPPSDDILETLGSSSNEPSPRYLACWLKRSRPSWSYYSVSRGRQCLWPPCWA